MPRPPKWKVKLKPFQDDYEAMLRSVNERVVSMSDKELRELIDLVGKPSDTNCGWTLYAVNKHVKDALSLELASRGLAAMGL